MKKITAIILSIALLVLTGCSGGGNAKTSPSEASPEAASESSSVDKSTSTGASSDDKSIVAYVGTSIFDSSLDPIKGAMSYGYSFTSAALLKVDSSSKYVGDMAESWTVSEDALTYTFNLRKGIRFSDGSEMTAADVVFTYNMVKENQAENENVDLSRLESVTADGNHTVHFTLSEPYSPFLDTTAMLGIVPQNSYDSTSFDRMPIGTGPWKIVQYDANQQIIAEPNEYYYEGTTSLDRVSLVYLDNDSALSAARSGKLDVVMVSPDYAGETIDGMSMHPLETMDIRMISLPVIEPIEKDGVTYGNAITSDSAVRQALAIGIDRKAIIENAFNGIGKPAGGFTDNLIWASADAFGDAKTEDAKAILESAGWTDEDGDGFREREGASCEFDVYCAEDRYVLAAALAENAAALGIRITPHSSNWDDISTNMNSQGVLWGWGQYSPTVIESLLYSEKAFSGGYDNVVSYESKEVDDYIDAALSSVSQEDAIENWKKAQTAARDDNPYLYLVNIEHCYFISDRLDISQETQIPHPHGHGAPIICNMKDWTVK